MTENTEMRILTVRQPWAHAIIHLGKDVENRVRNIAGSYRGAVAIHVAQRVDQWREATLASAGQALERACGEYMRERAVLFDTAPWYQNPGAIIGVVDLIGAHKCAGTPTNRPRCYEANGFSDAVNAGTGLCSPWADQFAENHLVLANPRPLAVPIPYRGALGLRRLDEETIAQIAAQIGA